MENQNSGSATIGKQQSIDDAIKAYNEIQEKAKAEAASNSKFVKLKDGQQLSFLLTGKFERSWKEFTPGEGQKELMEFELVEKNPKGENKIFSCSMKSGVCGELLNGIKRGELAVTLKRSGTGGKTTYLVLTSKGA